MSGTADIIYRRASADDLGPIRALLAQSGLPSEDLTTGHLEHFFVGQSGADVVATAGLEMLGRGGGALFRSLAVASDWRGRRLAHELWRRVHAHALERGVREIHLLTTTAEGLFVRWGFRAVPRAAVPEAVQGTREFTTLCPSTAVVMVRPA
jgi:amino-acid N-acetyltransferase